MDFFKKAYIFLLKNRILFSHKEEIMSFAEKQRELETNILSVGDEHNKPDSER
jgi:hypothetical protein